MPVRPKPTGLSSGALHVLLALAEGERHGYAIMQEVARLTDGAVSLGPGTLYEAIARLEGPELLTAVPPGPGERRPTGRRPYRLTRTGRSLLRSELVRLNALVGWARRRGLVPGLPGGER